MTSLSSQERTVIQTLLELNYSVRGDYSFLAYVSLDQSKLEFGIDRISILYLFY